LASLLLLSEHFDVLKEIERANSNAGMPINRKIRGKEEGRGKCN